MLDAFKNHVEIIKLQKQLKASKGNLVKFENRLTAEVEGQTQFEIPMSTFDTTTDCIIVISGRTWLSGVDDYDLSGKTITLTEGLPLGRTLDIVVFKSVIQADGEVGFSGVNILPNTIPLDRMSETVVTVTQMEEFATFVGEQMDNVVESLTVTSDIPIHLSINESGGLRITYDDGN